MTEYMLPSGVGSIFTIIKGPDGNIWYAAGGDKTGYITDAGSHTGYTLPISNAGIWTIRAGLDGNLWATTYNANKLVRITTTGSMNLYSIPTGSASPIGLTAASDGNMWFTEYNGNKIAKIGTGVSDSSTDTDTDGLDAGQELLQGTLDSLADTDGDGLNDYTESQWNTNRSGQFCSGSTCAYPRPTQKDIYVEVDWMPGYQPNSTQVNYIKNAFMSKGVRMTFDTGQYGGGNQVANNSVINFIPTVGALDFYDYKNGGNSISAQFDGTNRFRIWHYMLMGNSYSESTGSSGAAFPGDDDMFISYGVVQNNQSSFGYTNFDTAIAGTMIHEIGHNLCLSDSSTYTGQDSSCIYSGMETVGHVQYISSMSYRYQMLMAHYSSGANGSPNDHDDWSAVSLGINDFADSSRNIGDNVSHGQSLKKAQNDKIKLRIGLTAEQAKQLRKRVK